MKRNKTGIPSPSRSQGNITPRRHLSRSTRSVGSPARTNLPGRLSALVEEHRNEEMNSMVLTPVDMKSVLWDESVCEPPKRKSWWKKLDDTSMDVMDALSTNRFENDGAAEDLDISLEFRSPGKNLTVDLPDSSDSETINSIVIPQRRLFPQKENVPQTKNYNLLVGTRDNYAQLQKTAIDIPETGPKKLFGQIQSKPKTVFPTTLLNTSVNKTLKETEKPTKKLFNRKEQNKSFPNVSSPGKNKIEDLNVSSKKLFPQKETKMFPPEVSMNKTNKIKEVEVNNQPRKLFGRQQNSKRKNIFADFIASESEEDISMPRPKSFAFPKNPRRSSVVTDTEMDDWKMLPSSTMMEPVDDVASSPSKKPRLSEMVRRSEDKNKSNTSNIQQIKDKDQSKNMSTTEQEKDRKNDSNEQMEDMEVEEDEIQPEVISEPEIRDESSKGEEKLESIIEEDGDEKDESDEENESEEEEDEKEETAQEEEEEEELDYEQSSGDILQDEVESEHEESNHDSVEAETNQENENADDEIQLTYEDDNESHSSKNQKDEALIEEHNTDKQALANRSIIRAPEDIVQDKVSEIDENEKMAEVNDQDNLNAVSEEQQIEVSKGHLQNDDEQIDENLQEQMEVDKEIDNETLSKQDRSIVDEMEAEKSGQGDTEKETEEQEVAVIQFNEDVKKNISENVAEQKMEDNEADPGEKNQSEPEEEANESQPEVENESEDQVEENESEPEVEENESEEEVEENEPEEEEEINESVVEEEETNESEVEANESVVEEEANESEVNESEQEENQSEPEAENDSDQELDQEADDNESADENDFDNRDEIDNSQPEVLNEEPEVPDVARQVINQEADLSWKATENLNKTEKSLAKNPPIAQSLRESLGLNLHGSKDSGSGSGWDSHRVTKKTMRQTFGKDFSPRKSLRALVMENSAKRQTYAMNEDTMKIPQANSTEIEHDDVDNEPSDHFETANVTESDHEMSKRTRQTTLEMYLMKLKKDNIAKKQQMAEAVKKSLTVPAKEPTRLNYRPLTNVKKMKNPAKSIPKRKYNIPLGVMSKELIEDLKYKPPKRFAPNNASWVTKRLYKYIETKLENKYDYKARLRAEYLVEKIYDFTKFVRRHDIAPSDAVEELKFEMARLEVVTTHHDFYEFFHEFLPREIRIKVIPDALNMIPLPRHGVYADIITEERIARG